jgi:soluble lytic murein transglycosylase-like protein
MTSKGKGVRGSEQLLAVALAGGDTVADAARTAGMSATTAYRRAADPEFRRRVEAIRREIVDQALGKLTANATQAADAFTALLGSENEQIKLAAARCILDYRSRLKADGELQERVEHLETLVQELTSDGFAESSRKNVVKTATPDGGQAEGDAGDEPGGCAVG